MEAAAQFLPPYGPDLNADPVLSVIVPLGVVVIGALLVRRWRDLVSVAFVGVVVFAAVFVIQFPALAWQIAHESVRAAPWAGSVLAAYFLIFAACGAAVFATRSALLELRRNG